MPSQTFLIFRFAPQAIRQTYFLISSNTFAIVSLRYHAPGHQIMVFSECFLMHLLCDSPIHKWSFRFRRYLEGFASDRTAEICRVEEEMIGSLGELREGSDPSARLSQ